MIENKRELFETGHWEAAHHTCLHCMGRVFERKDDASEPLYLCADCKAPGSTRVEDACCCGRAGMPPC